VAAAPGPARPFVVAGEALVDIVRPRDTEAEEAPGGSPLNVAVGLARLGLPTLLMTELGDDEHGRLVADHVRASGVHLDEASVVPGLRTSTATAHLDEHRAATYDFDLHFSMGPRRLPGDARAVHVGSIGTVLHPGREAVVDLVRAAGEDHLVTFDPNARPVFLPPQEQALAEMLEVAALAQLVKLSDEDVEAFAPGTDTEEMAKRLLAQGRTRIVVVTHGGTAAEAFTARARVRVPSRSVEVIDTVGAGDSFMAALIATVSDWGLELDEGGLRALLEAAHHVAAVTVSRRGANPPTRRELPAGWPAG
jgi:fructokinase